MVQHMKDSTTAYIADATSYGNTGSKKAANEPIEVGGLIGKAQDFNGDDDYILVTAAASINNIFDGGGTVSALIYPNNSGEGGYGRVVDKVNNKMTLTDESAGFCKLRFIQIFDGEQGWWQTVNRDIIIGAWNRVLVTYNSDSPNNNPILYVNGESVAISEAVTPKGTRRSDAAVDLYIGRNSTGTATFDGLIDEVRDSNIVRSAAWVKADYYSGTDAMLVYP